MFISIEHFDIPNKANNKKVYEADSYRVTQDPQDPMKVRFDMWGPRLNPLGEERYVLDKRHSQVWVMNDSGKTIDSYTWEAARREPGCKNPEVA